MRTTRAHVSQHMHHAYMGDEGSWRHPDSGLEGRHDEWSQRDASPGRPAGVPLDGATNERQKRSQFWTTTRLQLERDELLVLCFHGGMHPNVVRAAVSVRTAKVDGCGLQACRRSDLRLFVTHSQICVSYACRHSFPQVQARTNEMQDLSGRGKSNNFTILQTEAS